MTLQQRKCMVTGMVFAQAGLFLLTASALYGFLTGSWSGILGFTAVIYGAAFCAAGAVQLAAGSPAKLSGILLTGGGAAGIVCALFADGTVCRIVQGSGAAVCVAGYIAGLTVLKPQRIRAAFNVSATVFLAACLVFVVNVVSYSTYSRMDWTVTRFHKLSDSTVSALKGLDRDLNITVFMRPLVLELGSEISNPIYPYTSELLERIRNANPGRISIRWFDPDWERRAVEELLQKYGVSEYEMENTLGVVVLEYGKDLSRYLTSQDLAMFEMIEEPVTGMQMRRLVSYTGEAAFLAGLKGLIEGKQTRVCFLKGHGEKDINSIDPLQGLPALKTLMKRENIATASADDIAISGIPEDCDVLVVAGPRQELRTMDIAVLKRYFEEGGNLILLLDPLAQRGGTSFALTGLEEMVEDMGVLLHNDIVTAWAEILGIPTRIYQVPATSKRTDHPVTSKLRDEGMTFLFESPRSMETIPSGENSPLKVDRIVEVSKSFWGETDLASYKSNTDVRGENDIPGPLAIGVAVSQAAENSGDGPVPRAVILGDSDFLRDDMMTGGNLDLFMNSIYWLSRDPVRREMMGIAPKVPERVKFEMPRSRMNTVILPITAGIPLLILLVGAIVWWRRR